MCRDDDCQSLTAEARTTLRAILTGHLPVATGADEFGAYAGTLDELGRVASLLPEIVAHVLGGHDQDVSAAGEELTRAITARRNALLRPGGRP